MQCHCVPTAGPLVQSVQGVQFTATTNYEALMLGVWLLLCSAAVRVRWCAEACAVVLG
jgi:hypothetical protein